MLCGATKQTHSTIINTQKHKCRRVIYDTFVPSAILCFAEQTTNIDATFCETNLPIAEIAAPIYIDFSSKLHLFRKGFRFQIGANNLRVILQNIFSTNTYRPHCLSPSCLQNQPGELPHGSPGRFHFLLCHSSSASRVPERIEDSRPRGSSPWRGTLTVSQLGNLHIFFF